MILYCNYGHREETGANLGYHELSGLLAKQDNCKGFHFRELLKEIKHIKDKDVLLTNSGPYAWIFHYLRRRYNKNFSIIRDVRTTLWSGYLLQEKLCAKYTNKNDKLIFTSEFTRQFYIKLFPHLKNNNTFVCYPIPSFPKQPIITKAKKEDNSLILGWLGSLCKGKNFEQALQIFIKAKKEIKDLNIKFLVCGKAQRKEYLPENIRPLLNKQKINQRSYFHINNGNPVSHRSIWGFLNKIDVLLFPSTANIESNPRVLSEADYMKIPVIASEYGGGYGIVPKSNLVKTKYFSKSSDLINNQPLGEIDVDAAVEKIKNFHKLKINKPHPYNNYDKKFLRIVNNRKIENPVIKLDKKTREFIEKSRLFIDKNYKNDVNKAIRILLRNDYYDIGNTGYKIVKGLGFNIYAKLNYNVK